MHFDQEKAEYFVETGNPDQIKKREIVLPDPGEPKECNNPGYQNAKSKSNDKRIIHVIEYSIKFMEYSKAMWWLDRLAGK
jgi:hypothetical protein